MARTQKSTQNNTKHVERQDATDIKKLFLWFSDFYLFILFYLYFFK